jgi:hypothetical protein
VHVCSGAVRVDYEAFVYFDVLIISPACDEELFLHLNLLVFFEVVFVVVQLLDGYLIVLGSVFLASAWDDHDENEWVFNLEEAFLVPLFDQFLCVLGWVLKVYVFVI